MNPTDPTMDSDLLSRSRTLDEKDELLRRDVDEGFGIPVRAAWDDLSRGEIPADDRRLRPHWASAIAIIASGVLFAFVAAYAYLFLNTAGAVTGTVGTTLIWLAAAGGGAVVGMVIAWRSWPAHRYTNPVVPATIGLVGGVLFASA